MRGAGALPRPRGDIVSGSYGMGYVPARRWQVNGRAGVLRRYYSLTKPGVLFGNVITGVAGFFLASAHGRSFSPVLFVSATVGMTLIIASACALNNVLDQDIDKIMKRTQARAVASGAVRPVRAAVFAAVLGVLGVLVLAQWTNWLVVGIGAAGFVVYVWLYGALSKRRSKHGTLVGSISGAMPILAGYCAVSGRLDAGAVTVFLMLFFWQFPEFYSIAIYRRDEYAAAHIPVITVVDGIARSKRLILAYTVLFVLATLALTPLGYTGYVYLAVMAVVGAYFIQLGVRGLRARDSNAWARRMFHASLNVLLILSLLLSVGALLP